MNPAREALTRAVNRAIAEGAPVYVNEPGEKTEFTFPELDPRARQRAREWFLQDYPHDDWHVFICEDAARIAAMLGIAIDTRRVPLHGGRFRSDPDIRWEGFWTQGSGACFVGRWSPLGDPLAALADLLEHAPHDEDLHAIALDILQLAERCNALIPDASVKVSNSYRSGSHSGCTSFDIDLPAADHVDPQHELQVMVWEALCRGAGLDYETFEASIKTALRALMDWIYEQLREEYEHLTSDEAVDGAIAGNDYTFDEDGRLI